MSKKKEKQYCAHCYGSHPRRRVYKHVSGTWLCSPHLARLALGERKDFRTKEAKP